MILAFCKRCRAAARFSKAFLSATLVFGVLGIVQSESMTAAGAATCVPAGSTGLTTAVVATSDIIATTVNATNCDIGIFVPPGANGITISGASVYGANDHGILVENATNVTITSSSVQGNGVNPTSGILENKAIQLVGTSNSKVMGNVVSSNFADGGISVTDNGPIDPGAPNPGTLSPAAGDVVSNNTIHDNYKGYGVVFAAYNSGGGVSAGTVSGNVLTGSPGVVGPRGPAMGGVVIAANRPNTSVTGMSLTGNSISEQAVSGIILDSDATRATVSGITVTGNTLNGNDWLPSFGPPSSAGMVVEAVPIAAPNGPITSNVTITGNTISGSFYGIWIAGATSVVSSPNTISTTPGGVAVYTVPSPGTGYWVCGADGGVYTFGQARFQGSMGGRHLNAPVVGMATTQDQDGYWLAASDGGVFSFGNAGFYGSMGGRHLNSPIVGMAATPDGHGYWLVAADGGVFSFGDAAFYGSMAQVRLAAQVVGMAATPDGHGYWLAASDGGVFSFGDAGFYGSMAQVKLAAQVVAMAATPDGHGYWLAGADGGVFSFGDAGFYGAMTQTRLASRVTSMVATRDGHGYWLLGADGGIFTFGDAGFYGAMNRVRLNAPAVCMAPVGAGAA